MMVNFQAQLEGQGQQSITVGKEVQNTSTTNGTTQTATTTIPYQTFLYFDSSYLSGYASCKTSNSFPNQKFSGSGNASLLTIDFTSNTPVFTPINFTISVSGVRLSNTSSTFASVNVRPPTFNQFILLQN